MRKKKIPSKAQTMIVAHRFAGWIFASHQFGAATASLGAGLIRVWFQDYEIAFLAGGDGPGPASPGPSSTRSATSPGPSAAPEPGTLLLLGPGLVALGRLAWRRHRS